MVIPLNDFSQQYIGTVLRGIAFSLGCVGTNIGIDIDPKGMNLHSEDRDIQVSNDFPRVIVESTVRGMVSPLKGVGLMDKIMIRTSI